MAFDPIEPDFELSMCKISGSNASSLYNVSVWIDYSKSSNYPFFATPWQELAEFLFSEKMS